MKMTNCGHVSCVAKLSVGAWRNGQSVKIAGAHEDSTSATIAIPNNKIEAGVRRPTKQFAYNEQSNVFR